MWEDVWGKSIRGWFFAGIFSAMAIVTIEPTAESSEEECSIRNFSIDLRTIECFSFQSIKGMLCLFTVNLNGDSSTICENLSNGQIRQSGFAGDEIMNLEFGCRIN